MKKANSFENFLRAVLRYYPVLLKTLQQISSILYSLINTIVSAFGALILLVIVTVVEHHRISEGVGSFESNDTYKTLIAVAIIVSLFFIEARIAVLSYGIENRKYEWSLRQLKNWFKEKFITNNESYGYTEIPASIELEHMRNMIISSTMFLVIFGSLKATITDQTVMNLKWYDMLYHLLVDSNGLVFFTVLSASLTAFVTIVVASKTTNIAVHYALDAVKELTEVRERITREDENAAKENIYSVGKITEHIHPYYSKFADGIPCIDLVNDLIDIVANDFYDSVNDVWIRDYDTPRKLKNAVAKICEKRREA